MEWFRVNKHINKQTRDCRSHALSVLSENDFSGPLCIWRDWEGFSENGMLRKLSLSHQSMPKMKWKYIETPLQEADGVNVREKWESENT